MFWGKRYSKQLFGISERQAISRQEETAQRFDQRIRFWKGGRFDRADKGLSNEHVDHRRRSLFWFIFVQSKIWRGRYPPTPSDWFFFVQFQTPSLSLLKSLLPIYDRKGFSTHGYSAPISFWVFVFRLLSCFGCKYWRLLL